MAQIAVGGTFSGAICTALRLTRLKSTTNTIGEAWSEYFSSGLLDDGGRVERSPATLEMRSPINSSPPRAGLDEVKRVDQ